MAIKEDGTDKDCINFFYDDETSINHGFLDVPEVLPLSEVNEGLSIGNYWNEEDNWEESIIKAFEILYGDGETQLYQDDNTVESDFNTDEFKYSELVKRDRSIAIKCCF